MKNFALAFALAVAGSGCIIVDDDGADLYESCFDVLDCDGEADRCHSFTADWPDGLRSTNSICTHSCFDSSDCPFSNGDPGICVSFDGGAFLCYESCFDDFDCDPGFACGDVGTGDTICLPR